MSLTLTNIPTIMRANKWPRGADLMDGWFSRNVAIAPKYGPPDTTTITMAWVLGFPRARAVFDQLVKDKVWSNEAARKQIGKMLRAKGLLAPGTRSFGDLGARVEVQDPDYVNFRVVGFSFTDTDDMSAALGNFLFRVVVAGSVTGAPAAPAKGASTPGKPASPAMPTYQVKLTEVGIYVADSYDFNGDQELGFWNEKKNTMSMINPFAGTEVSNSDFRAWRTAHNKGGDFRVLSDVKRVPLPAPETFDVQ